jgi:hypothetical protein
MIAASAGLPLSKRGPALDFPDRLYSMARELALLPGNKISTVVNMLSSPVMRWRGCCSRAAEKGFYLGTPSLLIVAPAAAVAGALWYGATGAVVFSRPTYCTVMAIMAKKVLAEIKEGLPGSGARFGRLWPLPRR